jgi:hypothetical protein
MAELGGLRQSHDPQTGPIEQTRTEEAHPNSMCAVTADPRRLRPAYEVVIRGLWSALSPPRLMQQRLLT